jgi:NAD(P)-dependent dehydrogenase (short-subunit alcohol dehydrogenase family)
VTNKLHERVGILTGTATGIGRAGALKFASNGARLVTVDHNESEGMRTVAMIEEAGGHAVLVVGDVGDPETIREAVATAASRFGKLDLVWGNAGIGVYKSAPDTSLDEWEKIWRVNVTGNFLLAKYAIPQIAEAGGGTVVFTASVNAFVGDRQWAAYCATKGAIVALTRALAIDHAAQGVRVNSVCPASTDTPMQEDWLRGRLSGGATYEDAVRADQAAHLLDRYATPDEIAKAALFLSCDDSSFSTGSALLVDGGLTAV